MIKSLVLLTGCLIAFSGPIVPAVAQVTINVDIGVPPPPPRVEVVPAPRRDYVWAPGYWRWKGREHVWVSGRWVRDRGSRQRALKRFA